MARGKRGEVKITHNDSRGRYETKISIGPDPITGRPRRQLIVGQTEREVRTKLRAAQSAVDEGRTPEVEKRTVQAFMGDWLAAPSRRRDSTTASYSDIIRLYILPTLGAKKVASLRHEDVYDMLDALEADGKSPNTRRLALSVLRRALKWGVQREVLSRNVAATVDGVPIERKEGRSLTIDQARQLLAAANTDRLAAAWTIALTLGLRRGEVLGLAWSDVDLDAKPATLTVRRTLKRIPRQGLELSEPKTPGSRRRVHLPTPTAATLRAHRKTQLEERLALGTEWPETPLGADLVFRTPFGTPVDPDNFRNMTYRLTTSALGERWSPHELRHSAASLLIAQGVPLKIVSEVLGHSSIRITSDVYGHLFDDATVVAADAMTEVFG